MNDILETIELGTVDGFDLKLNALVEYSNIEDCFDETEEGLKEIYEKLERYDLIWFCAQVTASKNGIKLASDYLGGCLYESLEQFIQDGGYIEYMKQTAINEAKQAIENLLK